MSPAAASSSAPSVRCSSGRVERLAARDLDLAAGVACDDLDDAVDVADLGLALGDPGLEQLLDARQALRDVLAGDAAGVERPHGQLRAGLADGLGGDDADRLADADHVAGGEVAAVAHAGRRRERDSQASGERTSTSSMPAASIALATSSVDHVVARDDERRRLALLDLGLRVERSAATSRPTSRRWNASGSSADSERMIQLPSSRAAVVLAGDDVLRDVDEAPGEVPGVRGAEGGVREALAGAVGADEVLEDRHALAEVAPHGDVDDPAGRVGHQAAHGAQLADVALVSAGPGVGHHPDRVLVAERSIIWSDTSFVTSAATAPRPARSARPR